MSEIKTRKDFITEAEKNVTGHRVQDYGKPERNFQIIADLWSAYIGDHTFTPHDVAMMMALMKVGRIRNGGGTGDSYVDLIGYAACAGEIHAYDKAEKEAKVEKLTENPVG